MWPTSRAASQDFIDWFEELRETGPGQGDPLFPWIAEVATREEMLWFLTQEVAGEAGFDDLLAITQVKMPVTAKLEMARNYWDEMGRGKDTAMHGPLAGTTGATISRSMRSLSMWCRKQCSRQCDAGLGSQPPLLLSVNRRARRHRDDRPDAGRFCGCWAEAPWHSDKKTPLFHLYMRCSMSNIRNAGTARFCDLSLPKILAAPTRSVKEPYCACGTARDASTVYRRHLGLDAQQSEAA